MSTGLIRLTLTLLNNGQVLRAGGTALEAAEDFPTSSNEIYDPQSAAWRSAAANTNVTGPTFAALLQNGKVLVDGIFGQTAVYDPTQDNWTPGAAQEDGLQGPPLTVLQNGLVLTEGGFGGAPANFAEIYTPDSVPVAGPVSATVAANSSANPITPSLSGGATFVVAIAGQAVHGVAAASGKTLSYTPDTGFSGDDSFTYIAENGDGNSAPATVSITVTPSAPPAAATLAASILPGGRSVEIGTPATVFATLLNTSANPASGCQIGLPGSAPGALTLSYQTTNPMTNAPTGQPGTPISIAAMTAQTFLLTFGSTQPLTLAGQSLDFFCSNAGPAPVTPGVNTMDISFSVNPVADVVALAATATNDGAVHVPQGEAAAFAVATVNLGAAGPLAVTADTGTASLPVAITLCRTTPATGQCVAPPAAAVSFTAAAEATPTFSVFVDAVGPVAFAPGASRIFVRFKDAGGASHGSTSVAVTTD
jgi:hypothetical protein